MGSTAAGYRGSRSREHKEAHTPGPRGHTEGYNPRPKPTNRENDAKCLLKAKWVSGIKHYMVQRAEPTAKPSWEPETNITSLLIEEYHINKAKTHKRKIVDSNI